MNTKFKNLKTFSGIVLMTIRAILPITLRIAVIFALVAFFWFLYEHGPKNTLDLIFSIPKLILSIFQLPFLKLHEDLPFAALSAILIYGILWLAIFHPKSYLSWLWTLFFILPISDAIYTLRYCPRVFRRHWKDPDTFFRSAKKYFRKELYYGLAIFHESPENRAILLETDPSIVSKMEKLNTWFRTKFPGAKFIPYVVRVDTDETRTTYICFRPSGFSIIEFKEEKDSNPFLHHLDEYNSEKHTVSVKNGNEIKITIEDVSKPISVLPFSQVLPLVRKSEYLFGTDFDRKELVRMKIEPGANSMLILLWVPWMGKSNLLTALLLSLYDTNGDDFRFIVTTTKPDLVFAKKLPKVLKYADEPKVIVEAVNMILREIESRKKLFSESWARDIKEYNGLPNIKKLPLVFAFFDELGDTLKALELLDDSKKTLANSYLKAITRLSITARAYGIVLVVATQSGLVSIFWQNGSEFRNSFSPVAFSLQSPSAESSVFGDMESGARRLPAGVCVWYDVSAGAYRKIRTPLVAKNDIDIFLAKYQAEAPEISEKTTEEIYLTHARTKGSLSLQDALVCGVSERRYRALSAELQDSWKVQKLSNNSLVFVPETQPGNGLQDPAQTPEPNDCKTKPWSDCKMEKPDPKES